MALQTSELWDTLWRTRNTRREYKFVIDGTEYGADAEVSHSVDNGLYEEFGIGNAACAKLTVSFFADSVPRGAKIERFVRLVNGEQASEWLPAGVYFANRRSVEDDKYWTVEAFDVMRKAEQPWNPDQSLEFPLPMTDAVDEFCRIMDCELDDRTVINPEYTVDYPTSDPDSETGENYTIRQVLQWIAAAHGGNWIITPSGALRLVPVVNISASESVLGTENGEIIDFGGFALLTSAAAATDGAEGDTHNVGRDLVSASDNGTTRPVSRITLNVDDENVITAGDDTGLELTADCPYATQEMADGILARLVGYQYRMFEAAAVNISPAAELGDLIEADGIYSVVAQISDDGSGYPDIAAPGEAEMEDEFPTGAGPVTREFNRKIAQTRSAIEKSAEEIRLEIQNEVSGLSSSIDVKLESITARVDGMDGAYSDISVKLGSITTRVNGLDSAYSALDQYVDSFKLTVSNGQTSSTIKLMAGSTEISSQNITFSGFVTFTGLSSGTTTIDGECIKTGTIAAEYLELTGAISWSDLSESVQNDIDDAYTMAEDAQTVVNDLDGLVESWSYVYQGRTYIDGEMLMTGTVKASSLLGGSVGLLDRNEDQVGGIDITLTNNNEDTGLEFWTDSGGIRMIAGGNIYLASWSDRGPLVQIGENNVYIGGRCDLLPQSDGVQNLGEAYFRWVDLYTVNSVTKVSDRNLKTNISYDLSAYDALFDLLKPASFQYDDKYSQSGRTHLGLISQDVEAAIADAGLNTMDFAGFVKSPPSGENAVYSLREGEFLPMCIRRLQQLTKRVAEIEKRLEAVM